MVMSHQTPIVTRIIAAITALRDFKHVLKSTAYADLKILVDQQLSQLNTILRDLLKR